MTLESKPCFLWCIISERNFSTGIKLVYFAVCEGFCVPDIDTGWERKRDGCSSRGEEGGVWRITRKTVLTVNKVQGFDGRRRTASKLMLFWGSITKGVRVEGTMVSSEDISR